MELLPICEVLPGRVACLALEVVPLLLVWSDAVFVLDTLHISEQVVSLLNHVLPDAHAHPLV